MEVVTRELVKIPNSVMVEGLTWTEVDNEVQSYLETHGSINRVLRIDEPNSEFHNNAIVEFTFGTALQTLAPLLPFKYKSPTRPDVTFHVCALASVYTPVVSHSATESYMSELQNIAKLTGKSFQLLLQDELTKLSSTVAATVENAPVDRSQHEGSQAPNFSSASLPQGAMQSRIAPDTTIQGAALRSAPEIQNLTKEQHPRIPPVMVSTCPDLSPSDLNPPEIQKVVVEHIVRNEEAPPHHYAASRLRVFSGRLPRPNNETDYETWRSSVELLLTDPALSDLSRSRKIVDSLLPPASDFIRHLDSQALPSAYLQLLDSAYGAVEDGDELFAKFMGTLQNAGEKPSNYLHRLQVVLNTATRRGGASADEFDRQLLKQFCRGCWDDSLIAELQLEQKIKNPPSFAELLLLLRTEEDKHANKAVRMKKHLGTSRQQPAPPKQHVWSQLQTACVCSESKAVAETNLLKKQVIELQAQMAQLTPHRKSRGKNANSNAKVTVQTNPAPEQPLAVPVPEHQPPPRPRPWYCFRCGEDGHVALRCSNEANPVLVAAKRKQFQRKRQEWETQNGSVDPHHLN
ncbi:uncharacterized protein LOC120738577 [Simochromis diagramma]|uniref:uncharacterized protein LOC120738577 n=1 Tax=Simochromis diagramma TaxID=43689 RepID=UPI001A7F0F53|nr:uncharacterized protein LOC120738577 [Simochromis diagramma]XP_039895808.1 uncharacterized protein LOC120738577 [Simochromis diagramma]